MRAIDLHTHSDASPDGSLTENQYEKMLRSQHLQHIAVTDHNTIETARRLHARFGNAIIIGEEIDTSEGEIIGLFLHTPVPPGLSAQEAARAIHEQGGLVYIPHPFETVRKGLRTESLEALADVVDIVEMHNGRALFQNRRQQATAWAAAHHIPGAAASDAHGWHGWGNTYSLIADVPTPETLCKLLTEAPMPHVGTVGLLGVIYPKLNRLRRIMGV